MDFVNIELRDFLSIIPSQWKARNRSGRLHSFIQLPGGNSSIHPYMSLNLFYTRDNNKGNVVLLLRR